MPALHPGIRRPPAREILLDQMPRAAHRVEQKPRPSEILAMLDSLEHFHFWWNPVGIERSRYRGGSGEFA
jgi:hypothetical protein